MREVRIRNYRKLILQTSFKIEKQFNIEETLGYIQRLLKVTSRV